MNKENRIQRENTFLSPQFKNTGRKINYVYDKNAIVDPISILADGIKRKSVSNADILTMSIQNSAKKRQRQPLAHVVNTNNIMASSRLENQLNTPEKLFVEEEPLQLSQEEGDNNDTFIPSYEETYEEDEVETTSNTVEQSKADLRKILQSKLLFAVETQLLDILNTGSYDEIISLHGIGKRRAQRILEIRNINIEGHEECGGPMQSLSRLEDIGMTTKVIKSFLKQNLTNIIGI